MRLQALAVSTLALVLSGCASTPPDLVSARLPEPAEYKADPFVPVNIHVNPNQHVGAARGALLEYAAQQLESSGAFIRTDRGTQRWLYTLQLKFRPQAGAAPGHWWRRTVSVLTLGLVPVALPQTEFLETEVFLEPEPVAKFSYVQPYDRMLSVYGLADPGSDTRAAIDLLLRRLMAEIASTKAVPRAREFDQPPVLKKKEPPRPKGQPT